MLRENLKDAGEIIQTILTQPLSIPGASENVSLLSAVQTYKEENAGNSDLSKIFDTFLQYPDPTHTLLTELELIASDLRA